MTDAIQNVTDIPQAVDSDGGDEGQQRRGKRPNKPQGQNRGGRDGKFADKPKKEFDEVMLEVRRVTRVTTGGRQLAFRATILVGNRKGKIGVGVAKGIDVSIAVQKASHEAYKAITEVPVTDNGSVPYAITHKWKSSSIKLMPAASGTGLKAGSAVRAVLELAGYSNVLSKIMGTNNKLNNALNTIEMLSSFKAARGAKKEVAKEEPKEAKKEEHKTESHSHSEKPAEAKRAEHKAVATEEKPEHKEEKKAPAHKEEKKDAKPAAKKENKETKSPKKPAAKK